MEEPRQPGTRAAKKPRPTRAIAAIGLAEAAKAREGIRHRFQKQSPGTFRRGLGTGAPPWMASIKSARQSSSSVGGTSTCRRSSAAASARWRSVSRAQAGALKDVPFHAVFFLRRQLAVIIQRNQLLHRIATHTNSPSTDRIFCVARNRQFLAASSVVPSISPMLRSRKP